MIRLIIRAELERKEAALIYSEQKNRPTKGQVSLVRQIAAQITKVNPWEFFITRVDILSITVPNNKYLSLFGEFILT